MDKNINQYEKLKKYHLLARKLKAKSLALFLSTVIGDVELKAEKEGCKDSPTNEVVNSILKAYIKRYNTEEDAGRLTKEQKKEREILQGYLPEPATEEQIKDIIININPTSMKDMKNVIGALTESYEDFDKKLVSGLVQGYIYSEA